MNRIVKITVTSAQDGKTVKDILSQNGFSSSLVRRLKRTRDGIMLDGEVVHTDRRVRCANVITLTMCDKSSENIEAVNIPLDILYEDEDIILINKPRAMPTHPSQNHHADTLANGIMYYFRHASFTFRVITRLDGDTSGIVLVAKNAFSAQKLNDSMQNGDISKEYVAVINGILTPLSGRIDAPISRAQNSVILRTVSPDGKSAVTDYETLESKNGLSLVRLFPLTGRTHQLRVHMQYMGCPIFGDDMYGAPQKDEKTRLHCRSLTFPHPLTGEKMTFSAPIPQDMKI